MTDQPVHAQPRLAGLDGFGRRKVPHTSVDVNPSGARTAGARAGIWRAWRAGRPGTRTEAGRSRAGNPEHARLDVAAIRARAQAATPGPWFRSGLGVRGGSRGHLLFAGRDGGPEVRSQAELDAEFVAHAREDVLALLDALEDARTAAGAVH
jgi:hypothetical protein